MTRRTPPQIAIRRLVCILSFAIGVLLTACGGTGEIEPRRPALNLILVSLDTSRADSFSSYGAARVNTPNLDRFAAEAVVFSDCLSQSTATAPSHMSLLTGQYVHRHGLWSNANGVTPSATLASVLRDAGWRTAAFTGHGSFRADLGLDAGFDRFESWTGEERWPFTRSMEDVLPDAEAWLGESSGEPFVLLVHAYDPHCPYWPPQPWREQYAGWYRGELDPRRLCGLDGFGPLFRDQRIGSDELRYLRDLYDAEIAAADAALGGFLDRLRESGLLDRSIVVVTSDHGEVLGAHEWVGHTNVWEEEMKVPLFVRFPQGRWARRLDDPVQLIDLMPTLLSALGVGAPDGVQGLDLMPRIEGRQDPIGDQRMRLSQVGSLESIRFDRRWKIAFSRGGQGPTARRIFDLAADPGEMDNLADQPEGRKLFDVLFARYRDWRASTRAEDRRHRGQPREIPSSRDAEILQALGYADD